MSGYVDFEDDPLVLFQHDLNEQYNDTTTPAPATAAAGAPAAPAPVITQQTQQEHHDHDQQQQQHTMNGYRNEVAYGTADVDDEASTMAIPATAASPAKPSPTAVMSQPAAAGDHEYESHDNNAVSPPTSYSDGAVTRTFDPESMSKPTAVDGLGMWKSWTRVFDQPKYACLDLLDNCLDATLHDGFDGKVVMKRLPPTGIVIINNSLKPIRPLRDVLVVYKSSKNDGANKKEDAIGENGVGLKHGCATLSETSFVMTRNWNTFSFGVIAKSLQTKEAVCLPSVEFTVEDPDDKEPEDIAKELEDCIARIVNENPAIAECVKAELGHGNLEAGVESLNDHLNHMWANNEWAEEDHVFQVLLTQLNHEHLSDETTSKRSHNSHNPASMFLHDIKELLPRFYINIPLVGFDFFIEDNDRRDKVQFSYWQHRLVELTKFEVNIPKEEPFQNLQEENWYSQGYPLSIYCGFEALRVADPGRGDAMTMYIYSRKSGRLIEIDDDARTLLALPASGSDYQQGMTIIIDDLRGELPLMPTKQGIAWSEQRGGEVHKRNLYAWASGAAQCFWGHHIRQFQKRCNSTKFKSLLKEAVKAFQGPVNRHLHDIMRIGEDSRASNRHVRLQRLEVARLTRFVDVDWKKERISGSVRWRIKKTFTKALSIEPGPDTLFKFTDETYLQYIEEVQPKVKQAPSPAAQPYQSQAQYAHFNQYACPPNQFSHFATRLNHAPPQPIAYASNPRTQKQPTTKKRKLNNEKTKVISIDDSSSSGSEEEILGQSKQAARKSTGGVAPGSARNRTARAAETGTAAEQTRTLQRALRAAQAEINQQKHLMAMTANDHAETVKKLERQLELARAGNDNNDKSKKNGVPYGEQMQKAQELEELQDELTIVKRQKHLLEKELQNFKDQRGAEVSGLKLEIEGLKLKLEQQETTIRKLQDGRSRIATPDRSRTRLIREEFGGTDSL